MEKWIKSGKNGVFTEDLKTSIAITTNQPTWEKDAKLISMCPQMLEFIKYVYNSMPKGSTLQVKAEEIIKQTTEL